MSAENGAPGAEFATAHREGGTNYGERGVAAYADARHGPDGFVFLDPHFTRVIDESGNDAAIIDVGCGAGPWSIYAAEKGAGLVVGLDYQGGMLDQAQGAIAKSDTADQISLVHADGAAIPTPDGSFSLALSINVGCNLPNTRFAKEGDETREVGFAPHFTEISRVLEEGGRAVVTAPTSFGVIFTDGSRSEEAVYGSIQQALETIGDSQDDEVIKSSLNELIDVYRATFAWRDGKWAVITDEQELEPGEKIWRKLPGLTVPNFYHSENEYIEAAQAAGLNVLEHDRAMFETEEDRLAYNSSASPEQQLGPEYVGNAAFSVLVLEKSA